MWKIAGFVFVLLLVSMLVLVSCNAESGTSDKKGEKSEYNSEGHLTKITVYYESGNVTSETYYD